MAVRHPHPDASHRRRERSVPDLICSARDCRSEARWGLRWNNPRLHTAERRKVWLACEEHRERLGQFLEARDFLRDTVPVEDLPADD